MHVARAHHSMASAIRGFPRDILIYETEMLQMQAECRALIVKDGE